MPAPRLLGAAVRRGRPLAVAAAGGREVPFPRAVDECLLFASASGRERRRRRGAALARGARPVRPAGRALRLRIPGRIARRGVGRMGVRPRADGCGPGGLRAGAGSRRGGEVRFWTASEIAAAAAAAPERFSPWFLCIRERLSAGGIPGVPAS
jgi:hypothetical protein